MAPPTPSRRPSIAAGGALDFVRPVALPNGAQDACFTVARTRAEASPGASLFVCQHHTPDIVWREDYLEQPNGATGLAEVIGIADDLAAIEDAYGVIFGERVRGTDDRVTIAAGERPDHVPFAERVRRAVRRGGRACEQPATAARGSARAGARPRSGQALLQRNGVPWTEGYANCLLVGPDAGCGTLFELAI